VTTAGDVAALLGGARSRVRTATALLRSTDDPAATLRAWSAAGPWQEQARKGDPSVFGLPRATTTTDTRQWVDHAHDRAREERESLVLVRVGNTWWRSDPALGTSHGSGAVIEVAAILECWADPQALVRAVELSPVGPDRVDATPRGDSFAASLSALGWGAARWELDVDPSSGMLRGTRAFGPDGTCFRRVEAASLDVDAQLDDALFRSPGRGTRPG
jgi:hypothetical protein